MYYVYSKYIKSGREDYVGVYETEKEAVLKIASCYKIDAKSYQSGEYYYFLKQH